MRAFALLCFLAACGGSSPRAATAAPATRQEIDQVVDAFHAAAAASNEEAYFALLTEDAVFLGTDATERWSKQAFREYAHPVFEAHRGWAFRAIRRDVVIRGDVAWFDEDLDAPNLGPSRGSGVLLRGDDGHFRIAQYNLALTIPNERFREIRAVLESPPPAADAGVAAE